MYQHLGDRRILERHYDNFKRYVDYVERRSPNGIAAFGLGDWCPADSKTPADLTSTAYAAVDARLVSRIAGLLGRSEDEAHYKAVAERFTAAFHQKYFKPDTASYAEGTQTALACALYQGMTSPEHAARVASNLVAAVERRDNHLDCGILGTKYLLHALSDAGRSDVALRVATQTTKPSWGYWLSLGATTLWEDWTAFPGSRDHIMFGDISAWSYRVLAGIRPDPAAPGFKHIIIRPDVTAGLDWVKAHHDTPQGRVSVSWARGKSGLKLEVVIPPNATAMVHVPAARPEAVTEGGRPLTAADGVTVKREAGGVAVGVGSGRYTFFAPLP
jgi:alpha-L-rhamnosidase